MKERILFVGVGACGANIAKLFEDKGYLTYAMNTSKADLDATNIKYQYHIPAASGCNKDRQKALRYAKDYHQTMCDLIDNKFPLQDMVFFIYGCGGGTGSGISPIMLEILTRKNPNKHYSAIMVLPHISESVKSIKNGLECYKQTMENKELTTYILDNNKANKIAINNQFVDLFNRVINMTTPDVRGVIDQAELETLLKSKGNTVIKDLTNNDTIFGYCKKGCRYIGLTTVDEVNEEKYINEYGTPVDLFKGYSTKKNTIIITGTSHSINTVDRLRTAILAKNNDRDVQNSNVEFDIPDIKDDVVEFKPKKQPENTSNNFDDIFAKYL